MRGIVVFAAASLAFSSTWSHEAAGGDVRIVSTVDVGGSVQSGGNVQIAGFVGSPGVVSSGGNIVARQGGNSMVYYATGFSVSADALTVNEQGSPDTNSTRTQLRGTVVYDDATLGAVDGALVAWSAPPPDSALASISGGGLAQASTVYESTPASFSGSYGGIAATNLLTVLNVLPDNYQVWAGDTFNDAWEIAQGMPAAVDPYALNNGIPNWQLYAMGQDLGVPFTGQLATSARTNGYLAIVYTRNTYATNYTFTPQEGSGVTVAMTNMLNPVSVTNSLSADLHQVTTFGSVPIAATNRQFLRVEVTQPAP